MKRTPALACALALLIALWAWVLPVADGVEDVATLALQSVEQVRTIAGRVRLLAAVELMVAAQACDPRDGIALGRGTAAIHRAVRDAVPMLCLDRSTAPDIAALDAMLAEKRFVELD